MSLLSSPKPVNTDPIERNARPFPRLVLTPQSPQKERKVLRITPPSPQDALPCDLFDAAHLHAKGEQTSPATASSTLSSPSQRPTSAAESGASDDQKRRWRASPRHGDLYSLSAAAKEPVGWGALPPSPSYINNDLHKNFWQWSREASRVEDKEQRNRMAAHLVQVSMRGQHELFLVRFPRVLDLPAGLNDLTALRRLVLDDVGVSALPDLSALVNLQSLTLKNCSKLRKLTWSLTWLRQLQQVDLSALPQLSGTLLLPSQVAVTVRMCPLLKTSAHPPWRIQLMHHNLR